jgi:acyl-CoA thioesterase FadM
MTYTRPVHPDPDMHRVLLAASRVTLSEPVRGYEMGQDGCLPFSGFARFFEHMRWELGRRGHLADPQMPKRGVVRAQTHQYLGELRFPNVWTGRTHLIHVGGSSVHYGHEITRGDGQVLVRARTVIVLLDGSSRPAAAPSYLRDYADSAFEAPTPLALPEPAWTGTPTYTVHVRPSDQDSFGHVNQARYLDFVDDARRSAGLGRLLGVSLSYERETLAGDTLAIELGAASPAEAQASSTAQHAFRMVRTSDGVVVHRGVLQVAEESAR